MRRAASAAGAERLGEMNMSQFNGFLHIIGNKGLGMYRIGWTRKDPRYRFAEIQRCSPVILELIACKTVEDVEEEKFRLQNIFPLNHIRDGWFQLTREELDLLVNSFVCNTTSKNNVYRQ